MSMLVLVALVVSLVALVALLVRWLPAAPPAEPIVPREARFDVPTLASTTPETEAGTDDPMAHPLDQEDFLQVEFVVARDRPAVDAMLDAIRTCATEQRVGSGYARVVVRPAPASPLRNVELRREQVEAAFPNVERGSRALRVGPRGGTHSSVVGGFVLEVPGLGLLYGVADADGIITSLGIDRLEPTPSEAARLALRSFTTRHGLAVVDWVGQRWI